MKRHLRNVVATFLCFCGSVVMAQELLLASELRQRCVAYAQSPQTTDAQICEAYVLGFVEGYATTMSPPKQESFAERAYRTRVGTPPRSRLCTARNVSIR